MSDWETLVESTPKIVHVARFKFWKRLFLPCYTSHYAHVFIVGGDKVTWLTMFAVKLLMVYPSYGPRDY